MVKDCKECNNWHDEQTTIAIHKSTHELLKKIRNAYRIRTRRNIPLGDILKYILERDPLFCDIISSLNGEQND